MKKLALAAFLFITNHVSADSRIKDIVHFEGIRENILVGYGLAVGLNGTGDNLRNSGFTQNTLIKQLNNMGASTTSMGNLNTKNVASVMVTATLPPFAHPGNTISVQVSTMGDAKSLKGGSLLAIPLLGADGEVYAIAQGTIAIGQPSSDSNKNKPIPTAGYISNGAIVERGVNFDMNTMNELKLALKNPDITTSRMIATAINSQMRDTIAHAQDPGTVIVNIPVTYRDNVVNFLSGIESLHIEPDTVAKVIIDQSTGTVVIGENVRISKVAIAQGNLVLKVSDSDKLKLLLEDSEQDMPNQPGTQLATIETNATLSDLVQGLNALGVTTEDLIAILKSIEQAGALQGVIEVR